MNVNVIEASKQASKRASEQSTSSQIHKFVFHVTLISSSSGIISSN